MITTDTVIDNANQKQYKKNLNLSHNDGNIHQKRLYPLQLTFPQLCRAFSTPKVIVSKLDSGYFLRCAGTRQSNETVADTADLLILDGDKGHGINVKGAVNPVEVHLLLNWLNIDHFIHTTHSHTRVHGFDDGVNRYRVLIPVTYTREQLPALLDWIFKRFENNGCQLVNALENSTWAQAWCKPAVHPDRIHLFKTWWRVGGKASNPIELFTEAFEPAQPFDVQAIYEAYVERLAIQDESERKAIQHEFSLSLVNESSINEQNSIAVMSANPIEAFNKAYSIDSVLTNAGYTKKEKSYLRPNSSSGIAGVKILDNGLIYSHGDDVLNVGKALDAFDCYRLLFCHGDLNKALNWNPELTKENQIAYKHKSLQVIKPKGFQVSDKINPLVMTTNHASVNPTALTV